MISNEYFAKQKRDSLLLLILSFLVFCAVSVILQLPANCVQDWYYYPDARSYREAAEQLFVQGGQANSIRPFGYPLLIGIPYLFGIVDDRQIVVFAIFLNVIAWLLTVQLLQRIVLWLCGRGWAWVASLLFLLSITHVVSIYQSLSETFFLFFILLALYTFVRFWQSGRSIDFMVAFGALCYSVTVRPVTYYFAILATLLAIVYFVRKKNLRNTIAVLCLFGLTLGMQMGNMYRCYGKFTVSFIQNYTMHMYVMAVAESIQTGKDLVAVQQQKIDYADSVLKPWPVGSREYVLHSDALFAKTVSRNLSNNKANVMKAMWQDMVHNSSDGNLGVTILRNCRNDQYFSLWQSVFTKLTRWQNKLFTMLGVMAMCAVALLMLRNRKVDGVVWLLLFTNAIAGYLLLTAGISFWQGDRFNAVLYPFTFINLCYLANQIVVRRANVKGT